MGEPSSERSDTSGASQAKKNEPGVQDTTEEGALVGNINCASGDASPLGGLVGNITKALEDAAPWPSANSGASAAGRFENTEPNSLPSVSQDERPPEIGRAHV